jgi:UDP-N-acetylmuramyl pentapeptide phosphotransferase/UDP-N-acetylglucosamine-1-phosphate transferase
MTSLAALAWSSVGSAGVLMSAAAIVTALLLILLRPLLEKYALARPNARSSHKKPTPQGAGVAVIATTICATIIAPHVIGLGQSPSLYVVLGAAALLALVGSIDDIHNLKVGPRLLLQTAAVLAVIATLPETVRVLPVLPFYVERGLLLLAGIWFVNLTNFMDGLDWMTVVEMVPVSLGVACAAALAGLPSFAIVTALALGGALIGFAPFNKPVARMFLGDVGSLPIGLLVGWLLVLVAGSGHLAAALLLPLYYLADATITLMLRLRRGEAVWQAHRTHFYQKATDRGFSVMRIVTFVFGLNLALTALALTTIILPTTTAAIGALLAGAVLTAAVIYNFAAGNFWRG